MFIDLHTHTTASDGKDTPYQLLQKAQQAGLEILSVSDHNTLGAYDELLQQRSAFDGKLLSGIEINTTFMGVTIEILGYGFDIPTLQQLLQGRILSFEQKQLKESRILMDTFLGYGVQLSDEFCRQMSQCPTALFDPGHESSRGVFLQAMKRREDNARFFGGREAMAAVDGTVFLREYVTKPDSTLYVDTTSLFPELKETVDIIHQSGGKAFLAHTYIYAPIVAEHLEELVQVSGVDGLECSYPTFSVEQESYLLEFCRERGLLVSCGSDHHGALRPTPLGCGAAGRILTEEMCPWLEGVKFL